MQILTGRSSVDRLAATIASVMTVAPPRHGLGDPLATPFGAAPPPSARRAARRLGTLTAWDSFARRGHLAFALRAALSAGLSVAALRRASPHALASLGVLALALGCFLASIAPDVSLSAIVSEEAFVRRALASMGFGAALGCAVLRARVPPVATVVAVSALAPAAALVATATHLASVAPGPALTLLLPSSGMLPAGVLLGSVAVAAVRRAVTKWAPRRAETRVIGSRHA